MKRIVFLAVVASVLVALGAGYFIGYDVGYEKAVQSLGAPAPDVLPRPTEGVACTMDAKVCPDGSYVGRVPPLCEFSPCPGE